MLEIEKMLEKNFSESDFANLEMVKCNKSYVHDFLNSINNITLGRKVAIAIRLKNQGHFNKSVLYISEVNRDQVLAIREMQTILYALENRGKTEVIFERFRQILPMQIGLRNGEEVLNLLNQIKAVYSGKHIEIISELHDNEKKLDELNEELSFFQERMSGRITENESNEIKKKVSQTASKIFSTKRMIVDNLIKFVNDKFNSITNDDRLCLIKNLYLVITSNIETLNYKQVEV